MPIKRKEYNEEGDLIVHEEYHTDKEFYNDGSLKSEKHYTNDQLMEEASFKNGKRHGSYKKWKKDGELVKQAEYQDGKLI